MYDSKAEARFAGKLKEAMNDPDPAKRVVKIERQPTFELVPKPNLVRYKADFRVTYADGRVAVIDVKGFKTPVFNLKMRLMRQVYPDVNIEIVR